MAFICISFTPRFYQFLENPIISRVRDVAFKKCKIMNRYSTIVLLCLFVCTIASAQQNTNRHGLVIHVTEVLSVNDSKRVVPLPGAQVTMVSGKDTVKLVTNRDGDAHHDRFRTDSVAVTVNCAGYETEKITVKAPRPAIPPAFEMIFQNVTLKKRGDLMEK